MVAWVVRCLAGYLWIFCIWQPLRGGASDKYQSTVAGMVGRAARALVRGGTSVAYRLASFCQRPSARTNGDTTTPTAGTCGPHVFTDKHFNLRSERKAKALPHHLLAVCDSISCGLAQPAVG